MKKDPKKMIEMYLQQTGLKPYQVADLAGVTRVAIYRFLKGTRDLKLSQWLRVEKLVMRSAHGRQWKRKVPTLRVQNPRV